MVVVSQIWIQHLNCMQIIGHCHLRLGSELEPNLGGTLYTALVTALAEIEPPPNEYIMSGVYGFKIPDNEGIGFFTIQNKNFRIFFLCEGLFGTGVPYLAGTKISKSIRELFNWLEAEISNDDCQLAHVTTLDDSSWFDLITSLEFGRNIPIEQYEVVYPLRYIRINISRPEPRNVVINDLETSEILAPISIGWLDIDRVIAAKIQGIFSKPHFSFLIYEALFNQISEFVPNFQPNTIILTYSRGDLLENQVSIVSFLSIQENSLTIRYCLPIQTGLGIEGSQKVHSYLRSIYLNPL